MEKERIKIGLPVIVEGKYDKIKLSSVIDAHIVTTEGFGVFKNRERASLIRRLSENGIIILTDSDGAGRLIRSKLCSSVPADKIYNLYVPRIEGKEKRKSAPSKEGVLGVEGMEAELLRQLFRDFVSRFGEGGKKTGGEDVSTADFYEAGLTGAHDSRARRDTFAASLGLPPGMTANSLLSAVNVLMGRDEFYALFTQKAEK